MVSSVYIAKNAYGGDGLGRLGDGRVVFVPGAFAGESVKAEIVEERRNYVKARLISVDEASPERTGDAPPPIPGMVYANLTLAGEVAIKDAQLREFLERARFNPDLVQAPSVDGQRALNYRNKVVYHFAKQDGAWVIGYRLEPSHTILDVTNDPLARPEINAKLPEIRRHVLMLLTQGAPAVRKSVEKKANLTIRWTAKSGVQWWLGDPPEGLVLKETTCGKTFEVPAGGFYQVNPEVGDELVAAVRTAFATHPTDDVLDLYCGVGVFGLCLAPKRLTGIESGRAAIEFAKKNAAAQSFSNARFFVAEVGKNLRRFEITERTIIVDPPRGGLELNVPRWLARSGAPRIFYVSCDPATLMRDLKAIGPGYAVESVRWFNMFPRTARFETLVVLKKVV